MFPKEQLHWVVNPQSGNNSGADVIVVDWSGTGLLNLEGDGSSELHLGGCIHYPKISQFD